MVVLQAYFLHVSGSTGFLTLLVLFVVTSGSKVLKALETAGEAGIKVAELAKTLKVKGVNLHVWFATTGKKNKAIKKVGKGHYKLQGK